MNTERKECIADLPEDYLWVKDADRMSKAFAQVGLQFSPFQFEALLVLYYNNHQIDSIYGIQPGCTDKHDDCWLLFEEKIDCVGRPEWKREELPFPFDPTREPVASESPKPESFADFLYNKSATVPELLHLGWCQYDLGNAGDGMLDSIANESNEEISRIFDIPLEEVKKERLEADALLTGGELANFLNDSGKHGIVAQISIENWSEKEDGTLAFSGFSVIRYAYGKTLEQLELKIRQAVEQFEADKKARSIRLKETQWK